MSTKAKGQYGHYYPATGKRLLAEDDCQALRTVSSDGVPDLPQCEGLQKAVAPDYRAAITSAANELRDFLLEKNASYGSSAFEPIGVFSKLDAREGILVRIDDKLKRLKNGTAYPGDDTVKDLAGYLIILLAYDRIGEV